MDEILDEEIDIENYQHTYSKLSLIASVATLAILIFFFFFYIPKTYPSGAYIPEPPKIARNFVILLSFFGIVMMIMSFTKKEPRTWIKIVGAILNLILILLIFATLFIVFIF